MNMSVFSYVKKLYENFYLALYALLLLIYPLIFCYLHVPALPCPAAPASVCASHSLTGTLKVPTDSQGHVSSVLVSILYCSTVNPWHGQC
jgi:hypothetical protein